jgi:chromosome segregation ATPase
MSEQNGDKPHQYTALEMVEQHIAAQEAAEKGESSSIPGESESSEDPLNAWKSGKPVTLEQIHHGLIATCGYAEAAIESTIKMAADVHSLEQNVEQRTEQMAHLTAKLETTSVFMHRIDEELAVNNKQLSEVRRDVQYLKDEMREMKPLMRQIPAIKDILGEILGRLPPPH